MTDSVEEESIQKDDSWETVEASDVIKKLLNKISNLEYEITVKDLQIKKLVSLIG